MSAAWSVMKDYRRANRLVREIDKALDEQGSTYVQAMVLSTIAGGSMRPSAIADVLGRDSQTITGILDRLERDGLVERVYGGVQGDRRGIRLMLTDKAHAALPALEDALEAACAAAIEAVPA